MMPKRNLEWLRAEVCRVLSVDPTNVDQAFQGTSDDPWQFIDTCINEAYEDEISEIATGSDPERVLEFQDVTWKSTDRTIVLPDPLASADIFRVDDNTHLLPGTAVRIFSRNSGYEPWVSWLDNRTLQWGQTGPGEDKTLRFFYIAEPPIMVNKSDEPKYIPYRFRWVLVWNGAINCRIRQGESAPAVWVNKHQDWRMKMHIEFSKGRPRDPNSPQQAASGSDWDIY